MPLYQKKEYQELCQVSRPYLAQYIKRGKVILREDNLIDTSNPINQEFMDNRVNKPKAPPVKETKPKKVKPQKKAVAPAPPERETREPVSKFAKSEDEAQGAVDKYNLDRQLKELEIEKKLQEIEKTKIQVQKLKGDVIPTDLVNMVFAQHFTSVTNAFYNAADNYIAIITARLNGKKDDIAFIRGELIKTINQAVKDGIVESKQSMGNIAREYSDKRGKGESR